ncbi:MAG: hypothetical protein JG767_1267 [Deferribacteraceae bacterium]|jgi:Smg protein|nr:hypothetical protein [Deferribacteraceae bacterium]
MDKLVVALNLIMDFIDSNTFVNEQDIADFLYSTGFDDYEIRQTLSMLDFDTYEGVPIIRQFCVSERNKLTQDAMLYLQKLMLTGFLDLIAMEEVIEKAMDAEISKIDAENIKQIILYTLLEKKSLLKQDVKSEEDPIN